MHSGTQLQTLQAKTRPFLEVISKIWLNCLFLSICQFVYHNDEQGAQVPLVCWRRRRKRHLHWRRRWTAILRQKGQTGQVVFFFGSFLFFYHFYGSFFLLFYGPLFCVKKVQAFPVLSSLQQKKKNDNVVQVTGGDTVIEDDLTADLFDIRGVSNTNMYKSEEWVTQIQIQILHTPRNVLSVRPSIRSLLAFFTPNVL